MKDFLVWCILASLVTLVFMFVYQEQLKYQFVKLYKWVITNTVYSSLLL